MAAFAPEPRMSGRLPLPPPPKYPPPPKNVLWIRWEFGLKCRHFLLAQKGPNYPPIEKYHGTPENQCFWSNYIDLTKDLTPKCSKLEGKWDPGYFREIQVGEILLHLARWRYFGWEKSAFCKSDELSMFSLKNVVWWVVKLQVFLWFLPDPWGFMIQFDQHIFQMGWEKKNTYQNISTVPTFSIKIHQM